MLPRMSSQTNCVRLTPEARPTGAEQTNAVAHTPRALARAASTQQWATVTWREVAHAHGVSLQGVELVFEGVAAQ